jgi:hypothetical protein
MASGRDTQEARRALGSPLRHREESRDVRLVTWLENMTQDIRHTLRRLRKTPAFTIAVVLTLGLGIGATTSIFTLVHAVMLKSLPVSNPSQFYRLGKEPHCCVWGGYNQGGEFSIVSYELYKHFRDNTKSFEELAAFQASGISLGVRRARSTDVAESYFGEFVSGNYFAMFGVNAYAGRVFTPADDQPSAPPAAIVSYHVWQQKYGSDPSAIGDVFNIDGKPFTVVGVTPPGFYGDTRQTTGFFSATGNRAVRTRRKFIAATVPNPLAGLDWSGARGDFGSSG